MKSLKTQLQVYQLVIILILVASIVFVISSQSNKIFLSVEKKNAINIINTVQLYIQSQHNLFNEKKSEFVNHFKDSISDEVNILFSEIKKDNSLQPGSVHSLAIAERIRKKMDCKSVFLIRKKSSAGKNIHYIYVKKNILKRADSSSILQEFNKTRVGFMVMEYPDTGRVSVPDILYVDTIQGSEWNIGVEFNSPALKNKILSEMNTLVELINKTTNNIRIGETGYIFIFDSKKRVLVHPHKHHLTKDYNQVMNPGTNRLLLDDLMKASIEPMMPMEYFWDKPPVYPENYTFKKLAFVIYYEPLDWFIGSSIYLDEIKRNTLALNKKILYIAFITLALSFFLSIIYIKRITYPLENLMRSVKKVSEGTIANTFFPVSGVDEFKRLGMVLNSMIHRINNATKELENNNHMLNALFNQSMQFVGLLDEQGKMIKINNTALDFKNCREHDVLYKYLWDTTWWLDYKEQKNEIRKVIHDCISGKEKTFEATHLSAKGIVHKFHYYFKPIKVDKRLKYILIEANDISNFVSIQEKLNLHTRNLEDLVSQRTNQFLKLNNELEEQKRTLERTLSELSVLQSGNHKDILLSLETLASGIAHEINNPLNFISSGINAMETFMEEYTLVYEKIIQERKLSGTIVPDEILKPEDIHFIANSLKTGVARIKRITAALQVFSRPHETTKINININELITSTIRLLSISNKDIRIETDLAEVPEIIGYPSKLNQVIIHVLMNAMDAIEGKGIIKINTFLGENHELIIEIRDNGIGIDPSIQSRIFDPFFTTKDVDKGTGLGLFIAQLIVIEHGGRIDVESNPGEGTLFRILLPV